jgi:hypothetical protein
MIMTLSHREEVELNPGCIDCSSLRGIVFEVQDLVAPEFSLVLDTDSSFNYEDTNKVMLELLNPAKLDKNRLQVEFNLTPEILDLSLITYNR